MSTIDGATLGTVWMALAAALLIFVWWLSLRRVLPRMTPKRRNRMLLWTYAVPLLAGPLLPLTDDAGHPGKRFMLKLLLLLAWVLLTAIVYNIIYKNKPNMRKKIVAGNWKMNMTPSEAVKLVHELKDLVKSDDVDVVYCVPAIDIIPVVEAVKGTNVEVGAEHMYIEEEGAFTGEIAPAMLVDAGVKYVIIGHSERRDYFKEDDAFLNKKVAKAFEHGLTPILCCGESLEQRETGVTMDWIRLQIKADLVGITADQVKKLVIAYEPIWAIGTGKTATTEQAQEVCADIRKCIAEIYDEATAEAIRIQYGGSVNAATAPELFAQPDIDGGLVGGASLKADFGKIVNYK